MSHALLSPSGASRWIACTPSARMEEPFPDKAGEAAREGTLAHTLAELLLKKELGIKGVDFNREMMYIVEDKLYHPDMLGYCEEYVAFVMEKYNAALKHTKDAKIFLEQKLDMRKYVPEGFGTGDVVIIANGTLTFIDLKYGKGVPVSAVANPQLRLYALGALEAYGFLYDVEQVEMIIHQPRLDSITDDVMTVEALEEWAETVLKPAAELAFAGKGEFVVGSHCQFCKAKPVCRAMAEEQLKIARFEFADPTVLQDGEIAEILDRTKMITGWLTSVNGHALVEAVTNGKKWPGYKLVEGRSNRKYSDDEAVAKVLLKDGQKEEDIYNKKLIGITAMEKLLTKPKFTKVLGKLVVKPTGAPTLVIESDKRDEIGSTAGAIADFEGYDADIDF